MKRIAKTIFFVAFSVVLMAIFIPFKSEAKDIYKYNVSNLKQKTWKTLKEDSSFYKNDRIFNYNICKITVPSNGYVRIDSSDKTSWINISTKLQKINSPIDSGKPYETLYGSKTYYEVFPKGTYYLYGDMYSTIKIRWSFVKASNPTNFCRAKAKSLASSKKETIVFNDGYEYDRWYKISLKKKQPITVYYSCLDSSVNPISPYFSVYTSKGDRINCPEYESGKSFRTPIQKKGTYYIRIEKREVSSYYGRNSNTGKEEYRWNSAGRIRKLSWK